MADSTEASMLLACSGHSFKKMCEIAWCMSVEMIAPYAPDDLLL